MEDRDTIETVAEKRALETGFPAGDWRQALARADTDCLSVDQWKRIAETASEPKRLERLAGRFHEAGPQAAERFLEHVDESSYGFVAWVEGLEFFERWLERRGLDLPLPEQIEYLECCAASAPATPQLSPLPELVREMLDTYGCESARPREAE